MTWIKQVISVNHLFLFIERGKKTLNDADSNQTVTKKEAAKEVETGTYEMHALAERYRMRIRCPSDDRKGKKRFF